MEGKERIVLKNGTVFEIENGASVNLIQVPMILKGFLRSSRRTIWKNTVSRMRQA